MPRSLIRWSLSRRSRSSLLGCHGICVSAPVTGDPANADQMGQVVELCIGKTKRSCRRVSMSAIRTPAKLGLLDRFYGEFNVAVRRTHRDFITDTVTH